MPNYKIIERPNRKKEDQEYAALVVSEMSQIRREKTISSTIQCASMQATIDRDPSEDALHWNRKLDLSKAVAPHPSTFEREIDPVLYSHFEAIRRRPKNSIGQSEKSSASDERKELARQAFTCTPASELTDSEKEKIKVLKKIDQLTIIPEEIWKELNPLQALWHWVNGGQVKSENKGEKK